MNIGTVVEGPTDRLVLQAVLDKLFPGDHRYFPLQPTETFGKTGTGWKGVRRWCRETWQREGSSLKSILTADIGFSLDLLVIHIDTDIATEHDLQEGYDPPIRGVQQPCPPVAATANQLRCVVRRWLNHEALPPQMIIATPAQNTENWTFAALFPDDDLCARDDYECTKSGRNHPGYRLTLKKHGKLLQRTAGGRVRKTVHLYSRLTPRIATNWYTVCKICSEAQRFTQDVQGLHAD